MDREQEDLPVDPGMPGNSAAREHDRRKQVRVHKTLMHHPFADKDDVHSRTGPAHERAFAYGSTGEQHVARVLGKRLTPGAVALHDRAIPGRRGNIDHIVVASSGVWVIDTKRYAGRLETWQSGAGERGMLAIAKRDQTHLVDKLARQVGAVKELVCTLHESEVVHGALCFVDTTLPAERLMFEGWHIVDAERLAKRINITSARVAPEAVQALAAAIARHFPPA
jgi:hypothetical protein